MHILPNTSRNKGNQAMKFGQLIDYNMRNNFIKKLYAKCGGETSTRSKILYSVFLLYVKLRATEIY